MHALVGGFALLAVLLAARRMPASWTLLAAVLLLPSMGLGVIGLGRYSNEAFPVAMARGARKRALVMRNPTAAPNAIPATPCRR